MYLPFIILITTSLKGKSMGRKLSLNSHVEGGVRNQAQSYSAIKSTIIVPSTNDFMVLCNITCLT